MSAIVSRVESAIANSPLKRYLGVDGGVLIKSKTLQQYGEKHAWFKKVNNVLFAAPMFKWGLAIVPLYGVFIDNPKVENIDVNQAAALVGTGVIWAYYSSLVRPRAYELMSVSFALVGVHGYNIARRIAYDKKQKEIKQANTATTA